MDWTEPGPEEVAPGVYRIPLPLPHDSLKAVNVYAITGRKTNTLIDGGWKVEATQQALDAALAALGLTVHDFDRCLVTHHHRDHYTMAVDLRRRAGLSVALGEGERASITAVQKPRRPFQEQRPLLYAGGAGAVIERMDALNPAPADGRDYEEPDHWLDDGQTIGLDDRTLRVRSTPGHTLGHVVFIDDDAEIMFAGDHLLPHITPSIGFEAVVTRSPLADYLSSLALVINEPDRVLLPAHGPAGGSTHVRASELLAHHERRLAQTEHAVRAGAATAYEVAQALRWTRRERRLDELDPFNQMLAVMETIAHLDVLVSQNRIRRHEAEGVEIHSR